MNTRTLRASKLRVATAAAVALGASLTVSSVASASHSTDRFAGDDRFETAAEMAYEETECDIVVVNGRDFPDALAAGTMADDFSVLLTETNSLPSATAEALTYFVDYCGFLDVVIVGGPAVVSGAVREQIEAIVGYTVPRVFGENRYATAVAVAAYYDWWDEGAYSGNTAILVSGESYADALVAGPLAAEMGYPILLTSGSSVRPETLAYILEYGFDNVVIIGGEAVIPASVVTQLAALEISSERIAGEDRYATSVAVAEWLNEECYNYCDGSGDEYIGWVEGAILANGEGFADALAAANSAYDDEKPILLVKQNVIPAPVADFISDNCQFWDSGIDSDGPYDDITGVGGPSVISDEVLDEAWNLAQCPVPALVSSTMVVSDVQGRVLDVMDGTNHRVNLTAIGAALGAEANNWSISFAASAVAADRGADIAGKSIVYTDNFDSLTYADFVSNWNNSDAGALFAAALVTGTTGSFSNTPSIGDTEDGTFDVTVVLTFDVTVGEPSCMQIKSSANPALNTTLLSTCDAVEAPAAWTTGSTTVTYTWNDITGEIGSSGVYVAPVVGVAAIDIEYDDVASFDHGYYLDDDLLSVLTAP